MRAPDPVSPRPRQSAFARALPWLRSGYRIPAWSLAAGPALAAVAVLAVGLAALQPGRGGILMDASMAAALEKTASGKDAPLATVRPVLSFNSKTGAWCRQFEVRHADRQVSHALACRGEDRHWNVIASTTPSAGGIAPAGADRRKTIDDLAAAMMRGEPLSQADEAQAIGKAWRRP
jgi:hypothetical protein